MMNTIAMAKLLASELQKTCPKDKRNLVETIGFEVMPNGDCRIFIGGDALLKVAKAPYGKYTNEREGIYARETGQPLYHWIERTIAQVVRVVREAANNV